MALSTCNNSKCTSKTHNVSPSNGLCYKCNYLFNNPSHFPDTVVIINTCGGCEEPIPTDEKLCWSCHHDEQGCEMCHAH